MEPNFDYFEINTADLWEYEQRAFVDGKSSEEHALLFLDRIRALISSEAKPILQLKESWQTEVGEEPDYSTKKWNQWADAHRSLEELYMVGFFVVGNRLFQYDHNIRPVPSTTNFEYWFALKLRQYDHRISQIPDYLKFQLDQNFGDDPEGFKRFLKINIRQYCPDLYLKRVAETTSEWVEENLVQTTEKNPAHEPEPTTPSSNPPPKRRSNKTELGRTAEFDSFLLKAFERDHLLFTKGNNPVLDILIALKGSPKPFIDSSTSRDHFYPIFQNQKIAPQNRIVWTGTNVELQWFVKILNYDLKVIVDLKNDIWVTTKKCFVKPNGTDFQEGQLKNASGRRMERQKELLAILKKLQ